MPKVLLVDDEPSLRLTMAEFLKRAGYEVTPAADFESAAQFGNADFDVAVVDVNLPGRSGVELLQVINGREPYVPVIMITGEPNLALIPEIVRAGAYDFIAKPVVKDVLLKAVGRAAEKKRLIDEKRRLEQEVKRHAEELERRVAERTAELFEAHQRLAHNEKIAALGRVAAHIAHEVKNPLAGLLLYASHLRAKAGDKLPPDDLALVDKIIETVHHLARTVEQVLDFARPVRLDERPHDLNQIVRAVLQLAAPRLAAARVGPELALADAGATALVDESSMRAVLMNLILNAVEAMPGGGRLRVATETGAARVVVRVSDTGAGMDGEQVRKVFEPFHTTKSKGLGLGMTHARKIVELHGGAITVASRPGAGTTVEIVLPAQAATRAEAT
ncbi:MAG TPA: ATP-binding protein [Pyrinomonadaceae bacterium]|jgi:signal transduction histidine kinase